MGADRLRVEVLGPLRAVDADGDLTAEEGEERKADLVERITDLVNGELRQRGPGHGPRGPRD